VNITVKIMHYSIEHKLLLKYAKNYYIWSRHLKDTSKNMHWLHFFGPFGSFLIELKLQNYDGSLSMLTLNTCGYENS